MKISEVFATAVAAGQLSAEEASAATQHLKPGAGESETPWYLHALIAVGAWLAAIFFIGFAGAIFAGFIFESKGAALVVGAILLAGAVALRRSARGAFLRQVCLALSVTAHALILFGLHNLDQLAWEHGLLPLAAAVLAAVLYELYPDTLHRFLSCASALV